MSDPRAELSPDQWRQVTDVFGAVVERAPADRAAFLDQACGTGNPAVRREVEALLVAHQALDNFLETPPTAVAAAPTPSHTELAQGHTLGPYRVLRVLGHGGMATVYLARDERHRRSVALKVLHPELAHVLGPERFLREIEVAANLSHPHILPLHDSGEAVGLLYYVMPYVEGESLRDRLNRETQLPVDETLQIAREVADALAYAHGQGVIHRDIKPENILLSGGHALVADFGIARVLGQAVSARLTATGIAVGTAAYMSPEQASATSHVDGRSDVYSLGCVVYEMLAGEPPYTGPTAQAIMAKRFTEPVPQVRHVRPNVLEHVERAVTRALAPVPADRFITAAEFARALQSTVIAPTTSPGELLAQGSPAGPQPAPAGRARRQVRVAAMALILGSFISLGVLFALWRSHAGADDPSAAAKRLAVLPFENRGDSLDAYFADGITNAVRGQLTNLADLEVIARTSSEEYRRTKKSAQEIARELGVKYLLTATVEWQKVPGRPPRVQVNPELIDVTAGRTPRTRWQETFDAALTDVFQVQGDIAGQVAEALNVALSDGAHHRLAEKPTQSLPAYEAFLRGEAAWHEANFFTVNVREAIAAYERAVALDPVFFQAWAQLARAWALVPVPTPATRDASRRAAERALKLAPNQPEGHSALGEYYFSSLNDYARAFTEDSIALALAPGNADCLADLGNDEFGLGRWDQARTHLEQAVRLDPRSPKPARSLGRLLVMTRQYSEAKQVLEHALLLEPKSLGVITDRMQLELAQGDLAGAQAILRNALKELDPTVLVAYVAYAQDLMWVLEEPQQQILLRLTPSAFDDDRANWALVLAQTHSLRGNGVKARAYADSARLVFEQELRDMPPDDLRHVLLGLALAYLGRKTDARREGERAMALHPIGRDAYIAAYIQHQLARIYLVTGEPGKALDLLEPLLSIPYYLSPSFLKIDPNFAPLRGNPRFERLMQGK